jgi:hypothetical protein
MEQNNYLISVEDFKKLIFENFSIYFDINFVLRLLNTQPKTDINTTFEIHENKIYVKINLEHSLSKIPNDIIGDEQNNQIQRYLLSKGLCDYNDINGICEFINDIFDEIFEYKTSNMKNERIDVKMEDLKRLYDGYRIDIDQTMPDFDIEFERITGKILKN